MGTVMSQQISRRYACLTISQIPLLTSWQAFTPQFSQLLSQLLYSQPELRPSVLKALKVVVDSNAALAAGDEVRLAKLPDAFRQSDPNVDVAKSNVAYLRTQVESWLAVLFNVFSTVGRDGQGPVADVVSVWLAIADSKVRTSMLCSDTPSHHCYRTSRRRTTSLSHFSSRTSVPSLCPLSARVARRTLPPSSQ